jgi:glycosyltransferase involved in cell wall biosynthesis
VTRVTVHSVADLEVLRGFGLVDNVTLLPHGALPPAAEPQPIRATWPGGRGPIIGCYGFFLPHKGVDRLIEAFAQLARRWPSARLRLVCAEFPAQKSADYIAACRARAEALRIAERIEWHTGFLPDGESLDLLRGCDLVVLPYEETPESASGAMRVAMSSLVPVVTTPVEIFAEAGPAVLRVASGEPAALATGISEILRDAGLRQRTQAAAQEWLAAHDWALMAERLRGVAVGAIASRTGDEVPGWPPA